ncbi:MAG: HEAT repeat domain-containing protein, partial [Sedimentisphaerales bacterium]
MKYFRPIISKINFITAFLLFFCFSGLIFAEPNKPDENLDGQSKINRWTLFNSTDEQIRIDTAVELLKNPSSEARQILLEALGATDNAGAQASVCKAIRQFRSFSQLIPDKEDFIVPLMDIIRGQNAEVARLAAQASLIFTYRQIKNQLEDIAESSD